MPDILLAIACQTHSLRDNKTNQYVFSTIVSAGNNYWHDAQFKGIKQEGF
jgi:hypothetical protein